MKKTSDEYLEGTKSEFVGESFLEERNDNDLSKDVIDDSKRSVSFRLKTSDYGCIKTIARRKKMRESDVFRYLLRSSLNAMSPLYGSNTVNSEIMRDLSAIEQLSNADIRRLDSSDLELLALAVQPLRFLARRLSELTGASVDTKNVITELHNYLQQKYGTD